MRVRRSHNSRYEATASDAADAIAYGVPFIANPDLPTRFRTRATLNVPDQETFYTPGSLGYTDYPFLDPREDAPPVTVAAPARAAEAIETAPALRSRGA